MPELPEVERGRLLAESVGAGKRIRRARIEADPIVFDGHTQSEVQSALEGRRLVAAHRFGKQLWFELDRAPHPLWHFGMTGGFRARGAEALQLKSGPDVSEQAWPPRFLKALLIFDDGSELAFCDARRFARVRLRHEPMREPPLSDLGFDPYLGLPKLADLRRALAGRKTPIKSLLLDQKFAAGVGNWIADEVLYQAAIDPRKRASELTEAEARRLRTRLSSIIRAAIKANADDRVYPRGWLFHRRWGKQADAKMPDGSAIEFITVGGRTTAWVPAKQSSG